MLSTAQIERARSTPIGDVIDARGIRLRDHGSERAGPCPVCGGTDRFAINTKKNLFNCRGCNVGGDAIALVQHLDGVTFAEACAILAGELPVRPQTPSHQHQAKSAAANDQAKSTTAEDQAARTKAAKARLREALAAHDAKATSNKRKLIATFDYFDADGTLLYQKLKYDSDPKYGQRRPNGRGDWISNLDGVKRVLYGLPDLIAYESATVFVVEGEKDRDRVASLSLCATSADSGTWKPDLVEPLRNRDVIIVPDFDSAGVKRALEAANALIGVAASIRMIFLPGLTGEKGNKDVSDWLDRDPARASSFTDICCTAPLWAPDAEVEGLAEAEAVKTKVEAETPPQADENINEPLPFVNISEWRVDHAPPRDWGVLERFPIKNVSLLSGEGAAGKTLLLLQLGVAHALGRDWMGTLPKPGPFLYFGAEDDNEEIYRRLSDILKHYSADFSDLKNNFHLLTFVGEDAVLGVPERNGLIKPTPLYARLLQAVTEIKPVLIGIDTSADVFAGDENNRAQARQFIGMLRKIALQSNGYVLLNSHPSLTGINTGSGLSGSTGWHNSVRARAYFTPAKTDEGEEPDPNLRLLEFKKSNYGPITNSMTLRWENGVYKPVAGFSSLDKLAAETQAERLFLTLLDRFNRQNRNVCDKPSARNYAPSLFAKEDDASRYQETGP
jgi:RecA-family ATPase